jgi:hypothetical protein
MHVIKSMLSNALPANIGKVRLQTSLGDMHHPKNQNKMFMDCLANECAPIADR